MEAKNPNVGVLRVPGSGYQLGELLIVITLWILDIL